MPNDERSALIAEEHKSIRRMQFVVDLVEATIAQDRTITIDEAWDHVRSLKAVVVTIFPGKEDTFDLIYLPRFSRLIGEKFPAN
jgi:hypothetical protein